MAWRSQAPSRAGLLLYVGSRLRVVQSLDEPAKCLLGLEFDVSHHSVEELGAVALRKIKVWFFLLPGGQSVPLSLFG